MPSRNQKNWSTSLRRSPSVSSRKKVIGWRWRPVRATESRHSNQFFSKYVDIIPDSSSSKRRSLYAMCCWGEGLTSSPWIRNPKATDTMEMFLLLQKLNTQKVHRTAHIALVFSASRCKKGTSLRPSLSSFTLFFPGRDLQNRRRDGVWRGPETSVSDQKFDVQRTCALFRTSHQDIIRRTTCYILRTNVIHHLSKIRTAILYVVFCLSCRHV